MTSFRLSYLAIAIDNLYIHELLGYMRCLFFKTVRSSRPEVFCKKGFLRILAKLTGKYLCQSLFLNKVAGLRPVTLLKKETLAEVFSCDFCKISKNTFPYRTPLVAASAVTELFIFFRFFSCLVCNLSQRFCAVSIVYKTI